ncbi:Uncharacterised protein [Mycobacteroides abscessus subsp. abscessus]|nr:Uncharacterised protein [Mycobacteroides abscessus subsp. abscessus]SIN59332.1 Uncharacterised protein [Mycobacteroides abscessus subsp. abscessus]
MIAQPQIQLFVLAQPIRCLVTGGAGLRDVNEHLQTVQIVGGLRAEQFRFHDLHIGDIGDFTSHLLGQI